MKYKFNEQTKYFECSKCKKLDVTVLQMTDKLGRSLLKAMCNCRHREFVPKKYLDKARKYEEKTVNSVKKEQYLPRNQEFKTFYGAFKCYKDLSRCFCCIFKTNKRYCS